MDLNQRETMSKGCRTSKIPAGLNNSNKNAPKSMQEKIVSDKSFQFMIIF